MFAWGMVSSADKTREGVVPLIELRRVRRTKPESTHLGTHARNVTSQYGEDGIIARIFELIGARSKGVSSSVPRTARFRWLA